VGVPTLQATFPGVARRELQHLLLQYRRAYVRRSWVVVHVLRWDHPGAVWAIDFTEPPLPLDGVYPYVFVVRDLASGELLLSLPAEVEDARTAGGALVSLFREHGAPLVIKADNDSAFTAQEMQELLSPWSPFFLLSPLGMPSYNGSCEAGIGSLKTRAHHLAARHGRPGQWSCDDVQAAGVQANQTARPWGPRFPTPDVAWNQREGISTGEVRAFAQAVRRFRAQAREELGSADRAQRDPRVQAAVNSIAITRALVEGGYLLRRGRITPLVQARRLCRIP
jgi:transposase InsO family protein